MSERQQPPAQPDLAGEGDLALAEPETLDVVVVSDARSAPAMRLRRALSRERASMPLPTVQAAAVAAGGFVAGAAVLGLVHRRGRSSPALAGGRGAGRRLGRGARKGGADLVQIVGSRTLLVDVHLLGTPGSER